ncbi:hypothetical protein KUCAC02_037355, partial [Chaenocephalus aceratus]
VPITSKLKLEVTGHSGRGVFAPPHQQPCSPSQSCQPDYISAGRGDLRKGGCHKTNLYVSITLRLSSGSSANAIRPGLSSRVKLGSTPRQSRETLSTQERERGKSDNYQDHQATEVIISSPIPPMQFPHFEKSKQTAAPGSREQSRQTPTTVSREQDMSSLHVSKRHRKLLKTSPP